MGIDEDWSPIQQVVGVLCEFLVLILTMVAANSLLRAAGTVGWVRTLGVLGVLIIAAVVTNVVVSAVVNWVNRKREGSSLQQQ